MRINTLDIRGAHDLRKYTTGVALSGSPLMNPPHVNNVAGALAAASGVVMKTADQTLYNSDDVSGNPDDELFFPVEAGGVYRVTLCMIWVYETVGISSGFYEPPPTTSASWVELSNVQTGAVLAGNTIKNIITNTLTALGTDTVTFCWAQNPAAPENLTVKSGSYIVWTRTA